jgi:hypothetical protein
MKTRISVEQWRAQNARLFRKHNRAGALMMRPGMKERRKRKWMNAYRRYLDRIPSPEEVCDIYEPDWFRFPFSTVPNVTNEARDARAGKDA